jgi:hypothetical protein
MGEAPSSTRCQVSLLDGRLRSPRRYCGPRLWTPSAPRDSRILTPILRDFSRRDPEASCHLYSTRHLYSAMAPTASSCRDIASRNLAIPAPKFSSLFLRGPDTRSYVRIQRFSSIQIQRLSTFSLLASSRLGYPILGSLPCELPSPRVQEITRRLNCLRSTALVTSRVPPEGFRPLTSLKL